MDVLLLIPYHAAQAFNCWGELNYICFTPDRILSSFIVFFSPFFMPLLFLLAGMSTTYALKKRSYPQYIAERTKRLIVPFLFLYDILAVGGKSFAEYLFVFLIGYYVFSNDALIEKAAKYRYVTLAIGLAAGIADVYMFIWSGKDYALANVIAKAFTEWFMILALIGIGKKRLDRAGKLSVYMSQRSFPYFSFHFLWVVLFQYLFAGISGADIVLRYLVPVVLSFVVTFICAEICLRIPILCFLTGTKAPEHNKK